MGWEYAPDRSGTLGAYSEGACTGSERLTNPACFAASMTVTTA